MTLSPRLFRARRLAALVLPFTLVAFGAAADAPQRVRGTVVSLDGQTLTVKPATGDNVVIHLADNWNAGGIVKATLADIKPGVFVGVASVPSADGIDKLEALELLVFPEALRSSNEGHFAWDLKPGSMMTNATVSSRVDAVKGPVLKLAYKGGEKTVTVQSDTPIVTFAPATQADVKPGEPVFVPAQHKDDGSIQATRVLVGKDGTVPPM